MDINRHRQYLLLILKDIFNDSLTGSCLAFKGGTSLMFLYDLPRFSVDLDFNLLDLKKERAVFGRIKEIAGRYGTISDDQVKFFGPVVVLDYAKGERKLKIEVSNREYGNSYETRNCAGISMKVMKKEDMFAHKLCALSDRKNITGRDVFDIWFFLQDKTSINRGIVESRTGMSLEEYVSSCKDLISKVSERKIMQDIGELLSPGMKDFVRKRLKQETITLLDIFREYPLISETSPQPMTIAGAVVSKRKDGDAYVKAKVSGHDCLSEIITGEDYDYYKNLSSAAEKRKCAENLARKYYSDWWRRTCSKKDRKSVLKR